MKNIDKTKKNLLEETLPDITITNGNPPSGFERVTKEVFEKKDGEGCQVAKGSDNKYYLKVGSCPGNSNQNQQTTWTNEQKSCVGEFGHRYYPVKFFDDYATIFFGGEEYKFKPDGTLSVEVDSGDKFTGFWRCYGGHLKVATCEDKLVWYKQGFGNDSFTADTENWGEKMGCPSSSSSTGGGGGTSFKWDTNCGDSLKKGCKDDKIEKLQACLNKNKDSVLPDLVTDGKWGKKTQSKLEEKYKEYKNEISSSEIDIVCKELENITEPEGNENPSDETTNTTTKKPKYTVTFGENKRGRKSLKEQVDEVGQRYSISDKDFFTMALNYGCLPLWLNDPKIGKVVDESGTQRNAIYGDSINNPENKYAFFRDFTALNLTTGTKNNWSCEKIVKYVNRPKPCSVLEKFGVDCNLDNESIVRLLNKVTTVLQYYVDRDAVSDDIMLWNNMLVKNYPQEDVVKIKFKDGVKDIYPPNDDEELKKYKPADLSRYTSFKGVVIYLPSRQTKISTEGPLSGEKTQYCIAYLKDYLAHAILYSASAEEDIMTDIDKYRRAITLCSNSGVYSRVFSKKGLTVNDVFNDENYVNMKKSPFNKMGPDLTWSEIVSFLSGENTDKEYSGKKLKLPNVYQVNLQENFIKKKIKSTLTEMVLDKRKKLLKEEILKNRVKFLMEHTTFKSRRQRREFVISLIKEVFYVQSQGYDKKLINEEFWDVLKGFFGSEGSEAIFTSFKTKMGEWLTSHLSPKKSDGWIGNCIRKTIQDINMRDVHMITDCKFLSKKIANSVVQKLDEKMSNEELKDEGLYDVVRGGMSDNVKSTKFIDHIESKVSNMICPILYDISNKFDGTFKDMKKRAIGL